MSTIGYVASTTQKTFSGIPLQIIVFVFFIGYKFLDGEKEKLQRNNTLDPKVAKLIPTFGRELYLAKKPKNQ